MTRPPLMPFVIDPQDPLVQLDSLLTLGRSHDGTVERDLQAAIVRLRDDRDQQRERAERSAAALSWYADRSNYQEFRVESGAILGALQDDEAWAIAEHEDHPGDPGGVARAALARANIAGVER